MMITNVVISMVIQALVLVEGAPGSRPGDGGRALGPLQIHRDVIRDVNRIYGLNLNHRDARNPMLAQEICRLYLTYYGAPARLGRQPTVRDLARIWNGGPDGHRKPATQDYGRRVGNIYSSVLTASVRDTAPPGL